MISRNQLNRRGFQIELHAFCTEPDFSLVR
jgi:hypothetical protein